MTSKIDIEESKKYFCEECEEHYIEKITTLKVKINRSDVEVIKEHFEEHGYMLWPKNKSNWHLSIRKI